jgi:predicted nuclease with TOPRIM domain
MATTVERLGIVETKVENLNEKLDELKTDVKDMHDCLDQTRDSLLSKLDTMYSASCDQHSELAAKISDLEKWKQKWLYMIAGGAVVVSWVSSHTDLVINLLK